MSLNFQVSTSHAGASGFTATPGGAFTDHLSGLLHFTFSYENDVESVKKRRFNKQEITPSKEQVTRLPLTSAFKEWMIQWSSIHKTSYTHGTLLPDSLPSSSRIAGSTQLLHLDAIRNTFAFWHSCFRGKKWATRRHQHFGKRWPRHWKVDRWCFWWRLGECLWGHNTDLSFFGAFFGFWLCFGLEKTEKLWEVPKKIL